MVRGRDCREDNALPHFLKSNIMKKNIAPIIFIILGIALLLGTIYYQKSSQAKKEKIEKQERIDQNLKALSEEVAIYCLNYNRLAQSKGRLTIKDFRATFFEDGSFEIIYIMSNGRQIKGNPVFLPSNL